MLKAQKLPVKVAFVTNRLERRTVSTDEGTQKNSFEFLPLHGSDWQHITLDQCTLP